MSLSWTLGDILSAATTALGNRGDVSASQASFWANEAQRQVWDMLPHDLQEGIAVSSTTSGQNKISLPTDYQEALVLSNLSVTPNVVLQPINFTLGDSWTTQLGTPTRYGLFANWLELFPSPDSSYSLQLRYRKQLSTMTDVAAVPSVATRFRYPVMVKTAALLAQNVTFDQERAAQLSQQFFVSMTQMPNDRALRMRENHYTGVSLPTQRLGQTVPRRLDFDHSP